MENIRKIVRQTLQEYITHSELKNVEKFADNLFSNIGVDVEFTKHFLDRVNDLRNKVDITPAELKDLYLKTYKKYKELIPMIKPGEEKVITDPETNINVPFVMGWDGRSPELDMVNKTIMRKKDFKSYTPKLTLEEVDDDTLSRMRDFGMDEGDIDENGYVTLYHGGIELPSRLNTDEILFLTTDYATAESYANIRGEQNETQGEVFTIKARPEDVSWNTGSGEIEFDRGGLLSRRNGYLTIIPKTNENLSETSVKSNERVNIYRDNNYVVVRPLSERASCKYGAFTKWCISAPGAGAWGSNPDAVIIMILQRNYKIEPERQKLIYKFLEFKDAQDNGEMTPELEQEMETLLDTHDYHNFEDLSKIALVFTPNSHMVEIWDANNIQINDNYQFGWQNLPISNNVIGAIDNYISTYSGKKNVDSEMDMAENIDVPINVGDTVLGGKFKNKKIVVKDIDKNEKGDITINDKPLLRFRTIQEEFRPSKNFNESAVKVGDLYVEADNMLDAYNKSKNSIGPSSRSTNKPLTVSKLLDGSLILLDGHHRIADAIKYLNKPTMKKIMNLNFKAIIHNENYNSIEDMPKDFQYWLPFMDWADATFKPVKTIKEEENILDWFGNSEVTDDNGNPLKVYHFTNKEFNEFDLAHARNTGYSKIGFWFGSDENLTKQYGKIKKECYLKADSLLEFNSWDDFINAIDMITRQGKLGEESKEFRNYLIKNRYDGIKLNNVDIDDNYGERQDIYCVLNSNQIKCNK